MEEVLPGLEKQFNSHGYGFQFAVLAQFENLCNTLRSPWVWPTQEYPVQINGVDTRIDIIMMHYSKKAFMIAECKRAHPKFSSWCFFKAPYRDFNNSRSNEAYCDCLKRTGNGEYLHEIMSLNFNPEIYHVYVELKNQTDEEFRDKGTGRGSIEDAATQVCRGLNGFMNIFTQNKTKLSEPTVSFLPVIFTTANLFVSSCDLKETNIADGRIMIDDKSIKSVKWLFLHYHQSVSLKEQFFEFNPSKLNQYLYDEYVRTIAIVSPSGIEEFLKWGMFGG